MAEQRYGVNQSAMLRIGLQIERNEAQVRRFVADLDNMQKKLGQDFPRALNEANKSLDKLSGKTIKGFFPEKTAAEIEKIQDKFGFLNDELKRLEKQSEKGFATPKEKARYLELARSVDQIAKSYKKLGDEARSAEGKITSNAKALQSAIARGAAGVRANEMAYAARMASGLISPAQLASGDQMMMTARQEMERHFEQRARSLRASEEAYAQRFIEQRTRGQITQPGYLTRGQYDAAHARAIQEDKQRTIRLENEHTRALDKQKSSVERLRVSVAQIRNAWLLYNFATQIVRNSFMALLETSARWERAQMGLMAIGRKLNISTFALNTAVKTLTNDGLLSMIDASKAVNVMLSTGIGLPKTIELLTAAKDAAAFNRQGYLSMSEALYGLADGVKNFISRNTDNVGISKNLSVILREEARLTGRKIEQMSELERTQAVVNGLLKEAALYQGNAALAAGTLDAKIQKLDNRWTELKANIGDSVPFKALIDILIYGVDLSNRMAININRIPEDIKRNQQEIAKILHPKGDLPFSYKKLLGIPEEEPIDFSKPLAFPFDSYGNPFAAYRYFGAKDPGRIFPDTKLPLAFSAEIEETLRELRAGTEEGSLAQTIEKTKERFRDAKEKIEATKPDAEVLKRAVKELGDIEDQTIALLNKTAAKGAEETLREMRFRGVGGSLARAIEQEKERFQDAREKIDEAKGAVKDYDQKIKELVALEEQAIGRLTSEAMKGGLKSLDDILDAVRRQEPKRVVDKFARRKEEALTQKKSQLDSVEEALKAMPTEIRSGAEIQRLAGETTKAIEALYVGMVARVDADKIKEQQVRLNRLIIQNLEDETEHLNNMVERARKRYEARRTAMGGLLEYFPKETQQRFFQQQRALERGELEASLRTPISFQAPSAAGTKTGFRGEGNIDLWPANAAIVQTGGELISGGQKLLDAFDKQTEKERLDKFDALNQSLGNARDITNEWAGAFRDVNRAMNLMGNAGIAHLKGFVQHSMVAIDALSNVAQALQSIEKARMAFKAGKSLSGVASSLGGAASLAAAGVGLYLAVKGNTNERKRNRQRGAEFGATVQRGPQVVNITPVLTVQADGDVIFSADGMEAVEADLVRRVQQAIHDGEISLASL